VVDAFFQFLMGLLKIKRHPRTGFTSTSIAARLLPIAMR
jgi:hypothetical protein